MDDGQKCLGDGIGVGRWLDISRSRGYDISQKNAVCSCVIQKKQYLCRSFDKYAMPVTKQKLIRHYAMDRCLRNQTRRYYIEDLLAECNKALEANLSVATDESQSTITIVASSKDSTITIAECSSAKSAVVTAELQTIDWSNAVAPIRESR